MFAGIFVAVDNKKHCGLPWPSVEFCRDSAKCKQVCLCSRCSKTCVKARKAVN